MAKTNKDNNDIVLSYYDCLLRVEDINLLKGPLWLNDVIMGFYFEYLGEKHNNPNKKDLLFISPELTQLLKMSDLSQYNIFLGPLNASSYKFIFFPINNCQSKDAAGGSHWSLLVYSKPEKTCYHFDSFRGCNASTALEFARSLMMYFLDEDQRRFVEADCPQQDNGYDCGLYVLCLTDVLCEYTQQSSKVTGCDLNNIEELVRRKRVSLLNLIDTLRSETNVNK